MRPVEKGAAPDVIFHHYQDAEPFLEERIGPYCSFCEFPISHVPEVEHREAKGRGGEELAWENLLLSCKYCNTRKSTKVKAGEKEKYLWPDEDDTFHVFSYEDDIPQLNLCYLEQQTDMVKQRARALFQLIRLDHVPCSPKDKDRRFRKRCEARNTALQSKHVWDKIKHTEYADDHLQLILILAKSTGFFSVWISVFRDEEKVREALIQAFRGTRREFCAIL